MHGIQVAFVRIQTLMDPTAEITDIMSADWFFRLTKGSVAVVVAFIAGYIMLVIILAELGIEARFFQSTWLIWIIVTIIVVWLTRNLNDTNRMIRETRVCIYVHEPRQHLLRLTCVCVCMCGP